MTRDIWVDFNSIEEDGTVITLLSFASKKKDLFVGASVVAGDDDGNQCDAEVVEINGDGTVRLSLDKGSFRTADSESFAASRP